MAHAKDPISDMTRRLMQDLEVGMYYGKPTCTIKLLDFLEKLGIKSASKSELSRLAAGQALNIEPLDAILKSVTFDMTHLGKWPKPK